jgi:hypothetical protein
MLLGMHFINNHVDKALKDRKAGAFDPAAIAIGPGFMDYLHYASEDLEHVSYVDFWRWWYELERYKGDEAGLADLDEKLQVCLERGIKVKIDLAWSTWYTSRKDWQTDANMAVGPEDVDDWIHLCDLLGRHFRGRMALWMLQGEANTLKEYWQDAPIEHVQEIYRTGYAAFKRADPGVLISISGATPSVSREDLDAWCRANLAACRGMYDEVPMNFFADINGADPYHGLANYYQAIRTILDENGQDAVEIGSGESSIQWAEDSWKLTVPPPLSFEGLDPQDAPLSELKQAWRMNESMRDFYRLGGRKLMWWGTAFVPGVGWPWRWGFRKYEDWWGIWPESSKVPGTRIVYRYENDNPDQLKKAGLLHPLIDFKAVNLKPAWVNPVDPYHPIWEIYKFWAQVAPPGSEAIRLPVTCTWGACTGAYLQTQDGAVVLIQNDTLTPVHAVINLAGTGWPALSQLEVTGLNETIDYASGVHTSRWQASFTIQAEAGKLVFDLPPVQGFTTLKIRPYQSAWAAECVQSVLPCQAAAGKAVESWVIVRNTGSATWLAGQVVLAVYTQAQEEGPMGAGSAWSVGWDVFPGEQYAFPVSLPSQEAPGYVTCSFRLNDPAGDWFGPVIFLSTQFVEWDAPRKLVAFREVGHVRLKWFERSAQRAGGLEGTILYRSEGFQQPMRLYRQFPAGVTEFVDSDLELDHAYYYQVTALRAGGRESRSSNEDNAKALSAPRLWDAEIVRQDIPLHMTQGQPATVSVELRNTGSKAWDCSQAQEELWFHLNTTQLWGIQEEAILPKISLEKGRMVLPGECTRLQFAYTAPQPGCFENHWIMCMDVQGRRVFFGTPLLVETQMDPH